VRAREFFDGLESRVVPARLDGLDQRYRFEIDGEGTWLVVVRDGAVSVTEDGAGDADATIGASAETFDRMTDGRQNPTTAYFTGKLRVTGDLGAALKLQRLF
jgi:putative sterol carrier protein